MQIKIKETNEIKELTLIDPKNGICWVSDLVGGNNVFGYDEDGIRIMALDDYKWWFGLVAKWQAADNRAHELRSEMDCDEQEVFDAELESFAVDLEDIPANINKVCDDWEKL